MWIVLYFCGTYSIKASLIIIYGKKIEKCHIKKHLLPSLLKTFEYTYIKKSANIHHSTAAYIN